ncbi:hypothetical protein C8F04DRAFT_219823 [Mycena alexandri]|uniref:F-box domain-containing protein n=1 Tax=Mycena alexandri TaxID=1745969 RepID=A0AAD6TI87_9AGAR|nr:hypothetical protein C8F04DRAFT_219823 [Mycena alexandri]
MASHRVLPNELTNQVIQHSGPTALANCALVCRSWVSAAQRNLLSRITIHERNYTEIVQHLTSDAPYIAPYVKRLNVLLWGDLRANIDRRLADKTPLLHLLLPHISNFTNVQELAFDGCRAFNDLCWDEVWTDLLAAAFPSVKKLTVHYLNFEDLPDLVDLVCSFPQLTHLTAEDLDIVAASHEYSNEPQEPYEGSKTPPPLLESLNYRSGGLDSFASGVGPFLQWLAAGPQSFTTLYLDLDAEGGDVNAGVELLVAAGANLRTLSLMFSDQWHMWEGLELSGNTNLRSLVFRNVTDVGNDLIAILESLHSPLEHLTLGHVEHMDKEMWTNLVSVLTRPSLSSLKTVDLFVDSSDSEAEALAGEISVEYPEFFKTGIVSIACKRHHEW